MALDKTPAPPPLPPSLDPPPLPPPPRRPLPRRSLPPGASLRPPPPHRPLPHRPPAAPPPSLDPPPPPSFPRRHPLLPLPHGLVLGLVHAAAGELGRHGVHVNCVFPGGVATPLSCALMGVGPEEVEALTEPQNVLRGKVLRAADVAEAALFLASDQAGFISGHNLIIDGATTAVNPAVLQFVGL